jgi:outer membrane protein TolC
VKIPRVPESALAALVVFLSAGPAWAGERVIRLEEALRLALEHDEAIVIQREALAAADAGVEGAAGAYDPRFSVEAGWREGRLPVNSAFSGAPEGRLAPNAETTEATLGLEQLLPTGGTLGLRAFGDRATTDGRFEPLSPAYETRLGLELRQPLLRNRAIDAARLGVRVAASDRAGAGAGLETTLAATVAGVESAYWTLVAAQREIAVREQAVRLAEEQLSETEARIGTGAAPETEIAQPRAELERRQGELFASREAAIRA